MASRKAEGFEMSHSRAEAIERYREADKLLKLLREEHGDWNRSIVEYRARSVADALNRLGPEPDLKAAE